MQHKGFVEINIGKPISDLLDSIESCRPANDMLKDITQLIDSEIYSNYKLWKTNYIAADMLSSKPEYSDYYSIEDFDKFRDYINKLVDNTDVVKEEFRDVLLHIYANPVYNKAKIL
jgi:hypothetical protein